MSETSTEDTNSDKFRHPLSQAGVGSLIIGLSDLLITDQAYQSVIDLIAPVAGYFVIRQIRLYRKGKKLKKVCATIDRMIDTLEKELTSNGVSKGRSTEVRRKIKELKDLKEAHELADLEIELKK